VFPHRRAQLPAHRFRVMAQQGQIAVGGAAGEQVHHPLALQGGEALDQIAVAALPGPPVPLDRGRQVLGAYAQGRVSLRQQIQPFVQPGGEALLEVLIAQQRQQRRRQADGELGLLVGVGAGQLQRFQQRQITLDQGLEKPVLLQGARLCRPHVGQMGMQHQGDSAFGHEQAQTVAEFNPIPPRGLN